VFVGSLLVLEGGNETTPPPSLLQAETAQRPQPGFVGEVLQPPDHLCGPPLDPLQQLSVFLVLGELVLGICSFVKLHPCQLTASSPKYSTAEQELTATFSPSKN